MIDLSLDFNRYFVQCCKVFVKNQYWTSESEKEMHSLISSVKTMQECGITGQAKAHVMQEQYSNIRLSDHQWTHMGSSLRVLQQN